MKLLATHPWEEPLDFTARFSAEPDFALLYSGRKERFSGNFSFLFLEPTDQRKGNSWKELPTSGNTDLPQWVGYLGYGMRGGIERYTRGEPSFIDLPDFWLTSYARLFRFDHGAKKIEEFGTQPRVTSHQSPVTKSSKIRALKSNFTRSQYEASVDATLEKIRAGDFYQANITRKFFGEFEEAPDAWNIFRKLSEISPAPYSAFITTQLRPCSLAL